MNYLISTFDCFLFGEECLPVFKNAKYKILDNKPELVFSQNSNPFILDLNKPCQNVLKINHCVDTFYFLFPSASCGSFATKIKYKTYEIVISLSNKLSLTIDGEWICEEIVDNLKYSHFEIFEDLCLIYFEGKRNYLVVLKGKEKIFANYYDECNVREKEKYFMCKTYDSLNHGIVCHLKEKQVENYVVYLDDEDLDLKSSFVPHVFLDCVKVGNFKYCNNLLSETLKMEDEKRIKDFFLDFDYFYPINQTTFMLANKNTLAGIYEFAVENDKISNIILLHPTSCLHN